MAALAAIRREYIASDSPGDSLPGAPPALFATSPLKEKDSADRLCSPGAPSTTALVARGYRMLVKNKKEPWGQIVSRFLSPEGLVLGITFTPSMRDERT